MFSQCSRACTMQWTYCSLSLGWIQHRRAMMTLTFHTTSIGGRHWYLWKFTNILLMLLEILITNYDNNDHLRLLLRRLLWCLNSLIMDICIQLCDTLWEFRDFNWRHELRLWYGYHIIGRLQFVIKAVYIHCMIVCIHDVMLILTLNVLLVSAWTEQARDFFISQSKQVIHPSAAWPMDAG